MPHEQHDYSSPFNQSDHCFLRLLLLLLSSLLKLLIFAQSYEQSKSLCKKTARNLRTMEREGNRKTVTSSKREQPKTFHRFLLSLREAIPRPRRKTGGRIEFVSVFLRKGGGGRARLHIPLGGTGGTATRTLVLAPRKTQKST